MAAHRAVWHSASCHRLTAATGILASRPAPGAVVFCPQEHDSARKCHEHRYLEAFRCSLSHSSPTCAGRGDPCLVARAGAWTDTYPRLPVAHNCVLSSREHGVI